MKLWQKVLRIGTLLALAMVFAPSKGRATSTSRESSRRIPASLATLREKSMKAGQSFPDVVLIEDVHSSPEVQGTIAALILYAHHRWDSRRVFIEGAFGEVGPPPYPLFSAERGELTANELLRRGQLSGGELAAALVAQSPNALRNFKLIGLEDRELYEKNLEIFKHMSALAPEVRQRLRERSATSREWNLWNRLLTLRLTPDEVTRLRQASRPTQEPILMQAIRLADLYYQVADARSHKFLERARKPVGSGPCLMVVGGYHTRLMTELLREHGMSFAVFVPRVTERLAQAPYQDQLKSDWSRLQWQKANPICRPKMDHLRRQLQHRRIDLEARLPEAEGANEMLGQRPHLNDL